MTILKKDLLSLRKEIRAVEKKLEMLLKAVEQSVNAPKTLTRKTVKAKPKKKSPMMKAAAKKSTRQATATDQILGIIKRFKKGVDIATLKKKTGFDDKKVRNIVFRASKEGKIKKSGRGIYVGA